MVQVLIQGVPKVTPFLNTNFWIPDISFGKLFSTILLYLYLFLIISLFFINIYRAQFMMITDL